MNKILFALALLFASMVSIEAQESSEVYEKEFGIDAIFINRFLPLDRNIGVSSPYLFNYKKTSREGKVVRMGLDLNLNGSFSTRENNSDSNINSMAVSYRYGWGKRRPAFKNAVWYAGCDILFNPRYQTVKRISDNSGVESISNSLEIDLGTGIGPWFGLQYNFTEKIGIYTELTAYLVLEYGYQDYKSTNENIEGFRDSSFRYVGRYMVPGNLVVFFKL